MSKMISSSRRCLSPAVHLLQKHNLGRTLISTTITRCTATDVPSTPQETPTTDPSSTETTTAATIDNNKRAKRSRDDADSAPWTPPPLSAEQQQRNSDLVSRLQHKLILAPLTRGSHLPFRRLVADFGCDVTMSEMAFARHLLRGDPKEKALIKRASNEVTFGVQMATNEIGEGIKAGLRAAEAGADFVDLNCGCPIYEATKRGLGSSLLRKPKKLTRLVSGIAEALPIPLTVKVRTSASGESKINIQELVESLQDAGAAAVTIHGRTALQRYKRPADWGLIEQVARSVTVPVVGNGDVLTPYEATWRMENHGCVAVMVGRGALMKPWIFQEYKEKRELNPDSGDRIGIYRQFVSHMREHFGDDDKGKKKAFYFLPWHLGFFARYRPLPESYYAEIAREKPLISTRWEGPQCFHEEGTEILPLEQLMRCENTALHAVMADVLWESSSDAEAVNKLKEMAESEQLGMWEEEARTDRDGRDNERNERETEG